MMEFQVRSSVGQLKDFAESTIFQDMKNEWTTWKEDLNREIKAYLMSGQERLAVPLAGSLEALDRVTNMTIESLIDRLSMKKEEEQR